MAWSSPRHCEVRIYIVDAYMRITASLGCTRSPLLRLVTLHMPIATSPMLAVGAARISTVDTDLRASPTRVVLAGALTTQALRFLLRTEQRSI